jgi:hypothetical protein
MLSPTTPPGTRVMCINTRDFFYVDPRFAALTTGTFDGLTEGRVYTLRGFTPDEDMIAGFVAHVDEIVRGRKLRRSEQGYAPQRFRVLAPATDHVRSAQSAGPRARAGAGMTLARIIHWWQRLWLLRRIDNGGAHQKGCHATGHPRRMLSAAD